MAEDTPDITLPLTAGQISRGIGGIVEQTFPRPRQENTIPVGEMERRLTAYAGELVQAAYNDAAGITKDARERLARHLYLSSIEPDWRDHHELLWDRRAETIDFDAVYAHADGLLAVINGTEN